MRQKLDSNLAKYKILSFKLPSTISINESDKKDELLN